MTKVIVPEGFSVETYAAGEDPSVVRTAAGLVVACFGRAGDDADELDALRREVEAQPIATTPFVADTVRLDALLTREAPRVTAVRGGVLWIAPHDGLAPWLKTSRERARLVTTLKRMLGRTHWMLADVIDHEMCAALEGIGVVVRSLASHVFLAEVRRPEGAIVAGLCASDAPPRAIACGALLRAPRLRRRLLDVARDGLDDAFLRELVARQEPLCFAVGADRAVRTMSWPGARGAFVPAHGDLRSLQRALREIGAPSEFAVGALPASQLLAWARANRLGVALAVYPDRGGVQYVPIEHALLENVLAR